MPRPGIEPGSGSPQPPRISTTLPGLCLLDKGSDACHPRLLKSEVTEVTEVRWPASLKSFGNNADQHPELGLFNHRKIYIKPCINGIMEELGHIASNPGKIKVLETLSRRSADGRALSKLTRIPVKMLEGLIRELKEDGLLEEERNKLKITEKGLKAVASLKGMYHH